MLGADRRGWHFPQMEDGTYAGHHPGRSAEAMAHLEALREKGAAYSLFPQTAFWWLDFYEELRGQLEHPTGRASRSKYGFGIDLRP